MPSLSECLADVQVRLRDAPRTWGYVDRAAFTLGRLYQGKYRVLSVLVHPVRGVTVESWRLALAQVLPYSVKISITDKGIRETGMTIRVKGVGGGLPVDLWPPILPMGIALDEGARRFRALRGHT